MTRHCLSGRLLFCGSSICIGADSVYLPPGQQLLGVFVNDNVFLKGLVKLMEIGNFEDLVLF